MDIILKWIGSAILVGLLCFGLYIAFKIKAEEPKNQNDINGDH